jgi:hypothetical protein
MNLRTRLKELAEKSDVVVKEFAACSEKSEKAPFKKGKKPFGKNGKKEFGFFTSNKPKYDGPNGQFSGMDREVNPAGVAAAGVGVAGAGVGGVVAHKAILNKFGKHADDGFGNMMRADDGGKAAGAWTKAAYGDAGKAAADFGKGKWNAGVKATRGAASAKMGKTGLGISRMLRKAMFKA